MRSSEAWPRSGGVLRVRPPRARSKRCAAVVAAAAQSRQTLLTVGGLQFQVGTLLSSIVQVPLAAMR